MRGGKVIHGLTGSPEYRAWSEMRNRCYRQTHISYPWYGGRGIGVCNSWMNSFTKFLKDMGLRPSGAHSLDREDTNSDYGPSNCKWSTSLEQNRNKTSNVVVEFNGEKRCISEWESHLGFPRCGIQKRLWRGWSIQRALTTPWTPKHRSA